MSKKRATDEQIAAGLSIGLLGERKELPPPVPITPSLIRVKVTDIDPYDRNPRKEKNAEYEDIKNSVRQTGGLATTLNVTRRPGGTRYMIEAGGNTRLQILKELYEETGEENFGFIMVHFRPWVNESKVLSQHIIENNLRAPMTFVDRAAATYELKRVIEEEENIKLGRNELHRRLVSAGIPESQRQLTRYSYVVQRLADFIQPPLRAALGSQDVDDLKKLDDACRVIAQENKLKDVDFNGLFGNVVTACSEYESYDHTHVRKLFEKALAEKLGVDVSHVRDRMRALLASESDKTPREDVRIAAVPTASVAGEPNREPAAAAFGDSLHSLGSSLATGESPSISHKDDTVPAPSETGGALASIRQRIYAIAQGLASQFDLADCITSAEMGMGFVIDVPADPIDASDDPIKLQRMWLWWLLLGFSEQTASRERLNMIRDNWLRDQMLADRAADVFAVAGKPSWNNLAYQFLSDPNVEDSVFERVMELAKLCRSLRKRVGDHQLWERK